MAVDARFRREWRKKNPILRMHDIGIDLNDGTQKLGDGKTRWNALPYMPSAKSAAVLGEGAVPTELVQAVAALNETIITKQDVSTATTDTELTTAVTNLNSLLAGKQDTGTAATDAELLAAVNTLNAALGGKQDASTASTDAELNAHAADLLLHSSGQELAYAENVTGTPLVVPAAVYTDVPGCAITVPTSVRPVYLIGRVYWDITAMPATASAMLNVITQLAAADGTGIDAASSTFAGNTSGSSSGFVEQKVEVRLGPVAAPTTYKVQAYRSSLSGFAASVLNGATLARSWIGAYAR